MTGSIKPTNHVRDKAADWLAEARSTSNVWSLRKWQAVTHDAQLTEKLDALSKAAADVRDYLETRVEQGTNVGPREVSATVVCPPKASEPSVPAQTWRAATKYGVWLTKPPQADAAGTPPHWLGVLLPLSKGAMTLEAARAVMRNETWRQYGPEVRVWLGPDEPGELVPDDPALAQDWYRPGTRVVILDGGAVTHIEAVHGVACSLRGFNKHFGRDELRPADDSAFSLPIGTRS